MKIAWIFITVLLTLPALVFADEKPLNTEFAQSTLQSILPSNCIFSGKFKQEKTITGIKQPLLSSGKVFFSCKHGLIWKNHKPFKESVIYTKKNFHFRSTESSEFLPLEGPQHELIATMLIDLMSGNVQSILSDFSIHAATAKNNKNKTNRLLLIPETDFLKKGIERIAIEKGEEAAVNISLADTFDQNTRIKLSNLNMPNTPETDSIIPFCLESLPDDKAACDILSEPAWQSIRDADF